ncbi:uncharacterized [Tachysurus ichikawai]
MIQLSLEHMSVLAFNAPLHVHPPTDASCLTERAQAASAEMPWLVKIERSSVTSLPVSPLKENLLGLHSEQFCLGILHQPQAEFYEYGKDHHCRQGVEPTSRYPFKWWTEKSSVLRFIKPFPGHHRGRIHLLKPNSAD